MRWKAWNKADKTLLTAAVLFAFALCLHLEFPKNPWADGLLFAAEAALVGGIADWFAVTAIFRKPLGFPYHTAILPRRRAAFVESSVTMVQKEFFSTRKIFTRLRSLQLLPLLFFQLEQRSTQDMILAQLLHYARRFILHLDNEASVQKIVNYIKFSLQDISADEALTQGRRWLEQDGHDRQLLRQFSHYLSEKAQGPEVREAIENILEQYQKEHTKGILGSFFAGLAFASNLVNFEEAAALMQEQLLLVLQELSEEGSELQQQFLTLFYHQLDDARENPEFQSFFENARRDFMAELPLTEIVHETLSLLKKKFLAAEGQQQDSLENLPQLRSRVLEILDMELKYGIALLKENQNLQREIDRLLYDLAARSALQAQTMVGTVVRSVLNRLTDEQMNRLVYEKVEPDLLWIRMNGSIVGFGVGVCLFLFLHFIN